MSDLRRSGLAIFDPALLLVAALRRRLLGGSGTSLGRRRSGLTAVLLVVLVGSACSTVSESSVRPSTAAAAADLTSSSIDVEGVSPSTSVLVDVPEVADSDDQASGTPRPATSADATTSTDMAAQSGTTADTAIEATTTTTVAPPDADAFALKDENEESADELVAAAPTGTAYFVDSQAGDDANDGRSSAKPWRSIGRIADLWLEPGDQVYLARGSVWSDQLRLFGEGTADQPIVATAYGTGPAPIVEKGGVCIDVHGNHVALSEVHARDCWYSGVSIAGSNVSVRHSLLERNRAGIDIVTGSADNVIEYNRLVDNNVMERSTPGGDDDSGAFGILIAGDRNTIAWNVISGSDAFSHDYGRDGAAVEIYGGRNNTIHHNVAIRNDAFTELGHARSAHNLFAYNIVWSDLDHGSAVTTRGGGTFGPVLGTRLVHNTFLMFTENGYAVACNPSCSSAVLDTAANLVVSSETSIAIGGSFGDNDNVYVGGEHYGDISRSKTVDTITDEIWDLWFEGDLNDLSTFDTVPAEAKGAAAGWAVTDLAFPQSFPDAGAVSPNRPWTSRLTTAGPTDVR